MPNSIIQNLTPAPLVGGKPTVNPTNTPAAYAPTPTSTGQTATTPVVTSQAAQENLATNKANFKTLQDSIAAHDQNKQQQQQLADQTNQAKSQADQQNQLQKTQLDQKQQEINSKNAALGLNATPSPAAPQQTSSVNQNQQPQQNAQASGQNGIQDSLNQMTSSYLGQKQDITSQQDSLAQQQVSLLGQVLQGTIPLSAPQAALIGSLQTQLNLNIQQQQVANQAYTGSVQQAAFRAGGEYTPSQYAGQIANAVSYGVAKIQNLDNEAAKTVATLELQFQNQNYEEINKQFDVLNNHLTNKSNALKDMYDTVTSSLKDQRAEQQKVLDKKNEISVEAAKNGADAKTQALIQAAPDESAAIAAAGDYLQSASGTMGEYLQYKRDTQAQGLVPKDYQTYKDNELYRTEKIKADAKNQSDATFTASDKTQQKLEQQYRTVLSREFSSRTGSLGIENSKVNQANHLNSLVQSTYDPKTGNYNVNKSNYAELVMGLANLISPTGTVSDSARDAITQKTAKGDINAAVAYITGTPQNGTTQDVINSLVGSIDRQAETATRNREAALQNMRDQAPTDLEQSRINALNKSTNMVSYEGQNRISKANVNNYVKSNPDQAEAIAKLYEVPGATDKDIEDYLKVQGKLQ